VLNEDLNIQTVSGMARCLRASLPGRRKRSLRVRTRPRGQNTRPSEATQTDKVVQRRPRLPIPVSDLGPKCIGPDIPRVLSRPPCPPRAQPTEAPSHFPPPPLCFPAARALPPFHRRRRHAHRWRPLATPDRQKEAPPSTAPRRCPRPPLATLRRPQQGGLRELPSQATHNLFVHLPT
jgi:hypothetical protein